MAIQNGTRPIRNNQLNRFLTKLKNIFVGKNASGYAVISDNVKIGAIYGSYLEMSTGGNEWVMSQSSSEPDMHINYRQPTDSSKHVPPKWIFHQGTGSSYATFQIGELQCTGIKINGTDVTAAILALVSGTNAASEEEADAPAEEPEEEQEE